MLTTVGCNKAVTEAPDNKEDIEEEIIPPAADLIVYSQAVEISELPKAEGNGVITASIVGGSKQVYCFEPGLDFYRQDVLTGKCYKIALELPQEYTDGEIIAMSSGAGSGEIEIIIKAHIGEETVYPGCIYYCDDETDPERTALPSSVNDEEQLIERGIIAVELSDVSNAAVTDFAVRLFKNSIDDGKNTLVSPLSVLVALSMTANGADNNTLSQMEAVLGMPIEQLNSWISTYTSNLPQGENYKLNLANSIWLNDTESFTVDADFLRINADYYGAGRFKSPASIFKASFDNSTLKNINKWVEDNTDGMIKDVLDQISPEAIMYLVNALAFDAEWSDVYSEFQIRDGKFFTEDGVARDVELMYSSEDLYLEDEKAKGFIKYYKGGKYAFVALLPNADVTVSEYVASLDGERLNEMLSNPMNNVVRTAIPRFETKYKVEMSDTLKKMGMTDAFDHTVSDFSKMGESTDGNICISRVIHQTYINVDAKGTKAGAATVVEMAPTSSAIDYEPPKEVYLDRPFVYMIIDCETDIPFFIGTVTDL